MVFFTLFIKILNVMFDIIIISEFKNLIWLAGYFIFVDLSFNRKIIYVMNFYLKLLMI